MTVLGFPRLRLLMGNSHQGVRGGPANTKTAGGYTASNIRQASLELGGVPIPLFDVSLGGILKGSHPDLSYIRNPTCDSA